MIKDAQNGYQAVPAMTGTRVIDLHKQIPQYQHQPKVAYIVSRFPKITETFILYEMLAVEQQGVRVELYPLQRERTNVMHPEARRFLEQAHFQPFISWPILRAHLHFLKHKPRTYFSTLWMLLRANWGSLRFLAGALCFFPKSVYFAYLMATTDISHVHAHFASHPAAMAFVIHRLIGIAFSFTAHGSDLHRDRHMLREKVAEAAFVVPISEYNQNIILAECAGQFQEKLPVIHCGVDTQVFQPRQAQTPYEQGSGPFTILCVGTLHEVKGQTYLIEACRLLDVLSLDFSCYFIGDGPDLAALTQQATGGDLKDRIHFLGRLTQEEIAEWLRRADVLVAPSVPTRDGRREGIPVVLMEAMSSGVPVIASSISGIPELVDDGQNGFLVPPGDVQSLATAIKRLYRSSNLRQRLGLAGRAKVVREFDLRQNATALAQHFSLEV